jgi:DNA primase
VIRKENKSGKGSRCYDRFRNRIMFPIHDEQDRVVGFSGRTLDADAQGAKYVNTPETPLFRKSRILYGLNKARRNIVDSGEAVVCEGQIDVIRCHQAGLNTAVAAQGTAFTEEHARVLSRYADSVVIVFDTDLAGENAAIKTARLFMTAGMAVRVAVLPEGQDPDSFIVSEGAEAFRAVIESASSAVGFQIGVLSGREKASTEVGLMRIARQTLETIGHSPNSVQRARLIQETSERLGVPASALNEELSKLKGRGGRSKQEGRKNRLQKSTRPADELLVCECLVHIQDYPEVEKLVRHRLPLELFTDQVCRLVAGACLRAAEDGRQVHEAISLVENPPEGLQEFFAYVLMQPSKVRGDEKTLEDAAKDGVLSMWRKKLRKEMESLPEGNERRMQIAMDLKALRRWDSGEPIIEMEMAE